MPDLVTTERLESGVALVRIDRPKMNALSLEVLRELTAAFEVLGADPPGAVVLWGGERIFAAGADVTELGGQDQADRVNDGFAAAAGAIAALERIVVAAVNGYALGGGCELALACDLRIAGAGAVFGQPEVLLGIIPGGGGTQRLARLVGPARAKEIIATGRRVQAEEALRIGLVERVVDDAVVRDEAVSLAASLASGAVVAQGTAKRAVDAGLDGTLAEGLGLERRLFREVFGTEDATVGVRSFLESGPGKARFLGR